MKFGFSLRYVLRPAILSFVLPLLAACAGGGDGEAEPGETLAPTGEPTPTAVTSFEGEVVVYVVGPMSGPDAQRGKELAAGARLAAEDLNRTGGLLGN